MFGYDALYALPEDVKGERLRIKGSEAHHLKKVLRKRNGHEFVAIDGCGIGYLCTFESYTQDCVHATIRKKIPGLGESDFKLDLAVSPPRKNRFELILEKGTEIGVGAIIPLETKHTRENNLPRDRDRARKILLSATKQSLRSKIPVFHEIQTFQSFLDNSKEYDLKIIAHETATDSKIRNITQKSVNHAVYCVGPEGGFTDDEVERARSHGFMVVSLGVRRLRVETAAIVGMSILFNQYDS